MLGRPPWLLPQPAHAPPRPVRSGARGAGLLGQLCSMGPVGDLMRAVPPLRVWGLCLRFLYEDSRCGFLSGPPPAASSAPSTCSHSHLNLPALSCPPRAPTVLAFSPLSETTRGCSLPTWRHLKVWLSEPLSSSSHFLPRDAGPPAPRGTLSATPFLSQKADLSHL